MLLPIHIRHLDRSLLLDYELFMDYHDGSALAGAAIAWRAMERAAILLSEPDIWSRDDLSVSARHDGPGVRDALEYVTRCFTRERFLRDAPQGRGGPCTSAADFHFSVSDGRRVVTLSLRHGMVPDRFFSAVQLARAEPQSFAAKMDLTRQKGEVAAAVVARTLEDLFETRVTQVMPQGGWSGA